MHKLLSILAISLLAFAACSSQEPTTDDQTSEETSVEESMEETTTEEVVQYPEGCSAEPNLVVKSEEAGTVEFDAEHGWYLEWSPDYGTFYFLSYDGFDPQNYSAHKLVDGDVTVSWDLKTVDKSEVVPGVWNYRAEEENNKLDWLNVSTVDLAGAIFDDNGKVEITYLGDDYVCGTVTSDDGSSSLNGDFVAKFHKWEF